jgi:hypothetical protein
MILGTLRAVLGALYTRYRSTTPVVTDPRIVTANAWSCALSTVTAWPQALATGSAWSNTQVTATAEDGD